jgi:nicotinate-nucleotide adenylyltransferase
MPHTLLYGGTFDPIHHGHLITCLRAAELLSTDRILLIPAQVSPHKTTAQPAASPEHRLAMIRIATAGMPLFAIDDSEIVRPGPSYTIDTVEQLLQRHPDQRLTLLLGADQLPQLHTWRRIHELLERANVAILQRSESNHGEIDASSLAAHVGRPAADRMLHSILQTPRIEISSTDIRARVGLGLPIDFLVPESVARYIRENHLYQH